MLNILQYSPGATVTIALQTIIEGVRIDGYSTPVVNSIILPDLTTSSLYPLAMTRISTGLYHHRFVLPTGSSAIGTYLASVSWTDGYNNTNDELYQIIVSSAGGSFSISPT